MPAEKVSKEPAQVVIAGAGIVGLVLALALKKHVGVTAELYEKASKFEDDVGAGLSMYANGLRIIRDISPSLYNSIRENGHPYLYRKWMRHDGAEVAEAKETALSRRRSEKEDDLETIGIRRWRLQKVLYDAVIEAKIPVHFGKKITSITTKDDGLIEIKFLGGSSPRLTEVLFGADGSMSKVREEVSGGSSKLQYTGTTCLMGMADWSRPTRGICFPSACTTKCHACFFPVKEKEQCFQFHFNVPPEEADEDSWRPLSPEEAKEECKKLSKVLREDGWDEKFLAPISESRVTHLVRVGFRLLEPHLDRWAYGRVVLLGDAAHPPVPYSGQGAQMGIEDAGVLALLLKNLCKDENNNFNTTSFDKAMAIYEAMRIPRTVKILEKSKELGAKQQKRASNKVYNVVRENSIRFQVFFHGTLPAMFPGPTYDYKEHVAEVLRRETCSPKVA